MKVKDKRYRPNAADLNQGVFNENVLGWIAQENLWNIWIPKSHGGLELSFSDGLEKLQSLAKIDGSLGWTVTLCSGANFFFGNLKKKVADTIFINPEAPVCFGGSGGVFGIAEKKDDGYVISGIWKYATGAPYLTHFTLNATIFEDGKTLLNEDGSAVIRSFVIDKDDVEIIPDWNTMGLKATATHSFEVKNKWVHKDYSFLYNEQCHEDPIFKIHFSIFADLTLWVNYVGMATHFYEEAQQMLSHKAELGLLHGIIAKANARVKQYAFQIEDKINAGNKLPEAWVENIHETASNSAKALSEAIIKIYPFLGIRACSENQILNQIFKDYFTATQHHIFTRKDG